MSVFQLFSSKYAIPFMRKVYVIEKEMGIIFGLGNENNIKIAIRINTICEKYLFEDLR